ncbi:MAG: hypothetical protein HQM08_29050 [Candidatus Riflebacteria bacterium]|nr:hypothetical protein [Candidatus Riflebacteria bacterium]
MNSKQPFVDPRSISAPVTSERITHIGGKAANLEALRDANFPVPEFRVIPSDRFSDFLRDNGLELSDQLSDEDASRYLQILHKKPFSAKFSSELHEIWTVFQLSPICVRSSGTYEDLGDSSFAGQYESQLNIHSFEEFQKAVRVCWGSILNKRVRSYFSSKGLSLSQAGIALVVQEYVDAEFAGVAFTVNPISGRQDHLLLEYCAGIGEKLVSGQITPKSAIFDHSKGKLERGEFPSGLENSQISIFRKIQALFGRPQDVEWCLKDGKLWIVQSRPITKIQVDADFGVWTTADFRDGGVSSTVVTPYMWSLYDFIWQRAMPGYIKIIGLLDPGQETRSWGDVFFGRPYWNLGEINHCLLKLPGFKESNFFSDLGIQTNADYKPRETPITIKNVVNVLPTLLKLERYYIRRIAEDRKFRQDFPALVAPFTNCEIQNLSQIEFAKLYKELITKVYFKTETSYFLNIYNSSNAKLDFKVRLDSLNQGGYGLSYINLISGLLRMKHLAPMRGFALLAKEISEIPLLKEKVIATPSSEIEDLLDNSPGGKTILAHMRKFIQDYGYHSSRELDISIPRWTDDHVTVWRVLKTYLKEPSSDSLIAHEKRQYALYRSEVAKARDAFSKSWLGLVPFQKTLFFRALLRTRSYCWWREEIRDFSSRVYGIVRKYAVEGGRRLGLRDGEVFWLTWQQLGDALFGKISTADVHELIQNAVEYSKMYRCFDNPNELGAGFLNKEVALALPGKGSKQLQGEGCCAGIKEGIARVVPSFEGIDRIRRNEILITKFTDPGWTPVFHMLGGVVTETGGVLSHAAVISREYGIPAVLNVTNATQIIKDGKKIRLNGTTGVIELLE